MNNQHIRTGAWLAGMALALCIAARFWSLAFPVAAVPFPLTRAEVKARLQGLLGNAVQGYDSALEFDEKTETKNFIERRYGAAKLAQAAGSGVEVWSWEGRWFRPEQHEEYRASCDQRGGLVGFSHIIEEERALPTLPEAQARALAENFLKLHVAQHPLERLRYLEARKEEKPHRTDFTFVWEDGRLRMGDAPYHLEVTVHGSEVGRYTEYLKVPESWAVEYERQRAVNDLCYRLATFAASGIMLGLVIMFLFAIWHHRVRWRDAVPWGWLVLIGAVAAATQVNSIPEIVFNYPTTEQWRPFIVGAVFESARAALGSVMLFWVLVRMGDCIYREQLPGMASFRRALGAEGLRDPQTVRALGVGIAFATFAVAYVCLFYTAGQRIGVWCPVDVDLSRTMSGPMPWVQSIQVGLSAAFSEEMIFRVGAILLLCKLLRARWLAVVLAAASWGFLHSNYPQMPGYTRGIELTIAGIAWGCLMLRYGIVSTLTAHYLYDCWMENVATFPGESWVNKACALLVSLWPVGLFLWAVWRRSAALEPEAVDTAPRAAVMRPASREWLHAPLGLGLKGVALTLAGCAAAVATMVLLPQPQGKIMGLGKLDLSRAAILRSADAALQARGYSPAGYRRVTSLSAQGLPVPYLAEHGTLARVATLYGTEFPDLIWQVRYFRFLQPEEFSVSLDQHGRFLTWSHTILREAPGATLDEAAARRKGMEALSAESVISEKQRLVLEGPIQQEHRRDWMFAFDQTGFSWGEAKLRSFVRVQGGEAINVARFIKVPDAWILEHERKGWRALITGEIGHWTEWAVEGVMLVLLVLAIRKHLLPWRRAFLCALFPLALQLVDLLNRSMQFFAGYETMVPAGQYIGTQLGARAQALVIGYLTQVFAIAVTLGMLHWAWGWTPEQLWKRQDRRATALYWRDTLLAAVGGLVALRLLSWINAEALGHFWPADAAVIRFWSVEEWVPWIGAFTEALQSGYQEVVKIALQASLLGLIWRRNPRAAWCVLLLLPLMSLGAQETLGGFLWGLAYAEMRLLITAFIVLRVWRFNAMAIFLTYALGALLDSAALFLRKGGAGYQWEAWPLAGIIAAAGLAIWWNIRRSGLAASQQVSGAPIAAEST